MNSLLSNSATVKTVKKICSWGKQGFLFSLSEKLKKIHAVSYTKSIYCNFCNVPNRALTSVYGRFCARVSALFSSFAPAYTSSLFYRSCMAVSKFIKNIVLKSKVGVFLKHLTFRRLIIIAFTLSVFEDYFFRNIVKISFVASIWDEFIILAAFGYLVCRRASSSLPKISRVTPVDGYLLLFFGVGFFLMCVISPYPYIAFAGYRAVVEYMVWFFLMIRLVDNDGDFMTFFYTIIFLSLGMALHGIYQYIIAVPIPSGWVSHTEAGVRTRVFSIIGSPNILGSFFVLTAPMTASLAYYYKDIRIKIAAWCAVFLMCLSLLFTFSRGAWIGMAIAVFIFALFIDRRLIALMAAGASGALLLVPSIANRITYLFTADYVTASMTGGRMVRWAAAKLLLTESNPLFGFGLGRFGGAVAMQNKILEETDTFKYFYVDNYYLKTAVEMGYLGLACFILLLLGLLVWCVRSVGRIHGDRAAYLGQGMLAGMCGVLVHCYFENIFEVPYMVSYFWAMGALILYLGYFRKPQNTVDKRL